MGNINEPFGWIDDPKYKEIINDPRLHSEAMIVCFEAKAVAFWLLSTGTICGVTLLAVCVANVSVGWTLLGAAIAAAWAFFSAVSGFADYWPRRNKILVDKALKKNERKIRAIADRLYAEKYPEHIEPENNTECFAKMALGDETWYALCKK